MRWMRNVARLLVVSTLGMVASPAAFAWWNDDWSFRKELTFDLSSTGAGVATSPADVPVLVRLSLGNFQYFADAKPDGSDFRFIAGDDRTPLKHHVEFFDATSQMALVWVRVPRLSGGTNSEKIYLYYGNPDAAPAGDVSGTYDTATALIYHFGPPVGAPQDSSGYGSEPTQFGALSSPASLIAAGVSFAGTETISIPATGAIRLLPDKGWTLSAWVRIQSQQQAVVAQLADQGAEVVLGIDGLKPFVRASSPTGTVQSGQVTDELVAGQWHHLAVRVSPDRLTIFVDGVEAGATPFTPTELGGTLTIGGAAGGNAFFIGDLDELGVSSVAREADWIRSLARSQGVVAPLLVYGGDAQKEGGGEGYFAVTLRNVTLDGWVVIALCVVLFLFSMMIMITKALFLDRVVKGNARFLAEFRKLRDDPTALDRSIARAGSADDEDSVFEVGGGSQLMSALSANGSGFGVSTLYRLYHHGVREALKRVEGEAGGADRVRSLSPAAIEAIRATMDASLTRMTQRLSAQMVWLTISISGGPFLGLLGTVVGVMITFAAIALSGDVNVNAIAPGIAAALVATVAGLGVAIPCLFGYNYLNTRIKEIVADMRVFVDEFVTRLAETYS